ncbi:ubiquinol-cytochrome c reductase iron-sulfur subunit [Natronogracilivirga saccharolytica]|uniref:Rieske (2Fe-2S) protein n=1 Tax=Natronogracilivirga saccharolytica TaxID=2812953 RepID=A0A8J7USB1_9BACT|nr:Rieske (2Fe-2S) protein [Natronogracilivirga saccharolytica]MBP3191376.1 Rieske (2Fe-2S) protein [Natronogracilivirga saccharolytica]
MEKPEATNNNSISRKQFLKTAGSASLFAALGISLASCDVTDSNNDVDDEDTDAVTIENGTVVLDISDETLESLQNEGGFLRVATAGLLVVNVDGDLIRAFSDVCPHDGCRDEWEYDNQHFTCNCHGSRFENDGTVVQGPANRDLTEYDVSRDGDMVTILTD